MKKLLVLSMSLIIAICSGTMAFAGVNDYDTSWAKNEIIYMKDKGILKGYPDGSFKAENNMAKAEFYSVINGLMGFAEKGEVEFSDVNSTAWYYEIVQKGVKAGYILPETTLNADANITRGEVARIISVVFGIEENKAAAKAFTDYADIPESLKGVIGGLKSNGLVSGFPDGSFGANAEIKRAEVVKMLHNIAGEIVNVEGTVTKDASSNVLVNTADVVLKDMTIEGNLYLTEGIGEGDVTLDNVTVKGLVSVKGGGANSVKINNSKINNIIIGKTTGTSVRVVLENTNVERIMTSNTVKLELKGKSEIKLVELKGKVDLALEKGTTVKTLKADSKEIIIDSKGTIEALSSTENIKVNDKDIKANTNYKVEEGKSTEVKTGTSPSTGNTGGSSGGGSGGSSGGGSNNTNTSKSDIVSSHKSRINSLQAATILELSNLAVEAKSVEDTSANRKIYKDKVDLLEVEVNNDFETILSSLQAQLKTYGYTDDVTSGLRAEYNSIKTETYNEFKGIK